MRALAGISSLLLLCAVLSGCAGTTGLYFYPQQEHVRTPADLELAYDDVELTAEDGTRLHGWWLPAYAHTADDKPAPVVLFFHGNAENISTHIGSVYWLPKQGVNVFLLDYRGYGKSEGNPYIPAVLQDMEAALRWVKKEHPDAPLFILGQSIGAALSATAVPALAKEYEINGLIFDAGFGSYRGIAQHVTTSSGVLGWLFWPFTWLVPSDHDGEARIADLAPVPLLMFHSPDDRTIPYDMGRALFEQAGMPKYWVESRGNHIGTFNYTDMRAALLRFIFPD